MQVTVGVIDIHAEHNKSGSVIQWVDLSSFGDCYVARVGFFPDNSLALQIENRAQTKLQLCRYDFLRKQSMKILVEETSQCWINLHDLFHPLKETPEYFLWASERSGYMHLELRHSQTGQLVRTLTSGSWVVQNLVDVDENSSTVYFLANRETPLEIHLYSVHYGDETPTVDRLTQESGCHLVHCFDRTYQYCITQWNSIDQYPIIRMLDVKRKRIVKTFDHLQQRPMQILEQFQFVKPQLFSITNRHSDTLYCALYRPDDEQGKHQRPYPTLVSVYGGPHLQR